MKILIKIFSKKMETMAIYQCKEEKEKEVKDIINDYNIYKEKKIQEEKESKLKTEEIDEKKPKKKRWRKRRILKYGVCIIFSLYVLKTIISLGRGYFSNEKLFNIFLTIIIGHILLIIQKRK